MDILIRDADKNDFKDILKLIKKVHDNTTISKNTWENIFKNNWGKSDDKIGIVLVHKTNIVGFIGTIYSYRYFNNLEYRFCNLTTWIVEKNYRNYSLQILLKTIAKKKTIYTAFTASPSAGKIYDALGFKKFDKELRIVPVFGALQSIFNNYKIITKKELIIKHLNANELKLHYDHENHFGISILFKTRNDQCFILIKKTKIKFLTFARVHYISDIEIFNKCCGGITLKIAYYFRVIGLIVDSRYLRQGYSKIMTYKKLLPHPLIYKSNLSINIDTLYSEIFLLNL